jgi:prevent-host-death family protein
VLHGATECHPAVVSENHAISQRDLRTRSREIMDAVERGETFTVTGDGRGIAELVPLRSQRQFVPADELLGIGRGLGVDELADPVADDPFAR